MVEKLNAVNRVSVYESPWSVGVKQCAEVQHIVCVVGNIVLRARNKEEINCKPFGEWRPLLPPVDDTNPA